MPSVPIEIPPVKTEIPVEPIKPEIPAEIPKDPADLPKKRRLTEEDMKYRYKGGKPVRMMMRRTANKKKAKTNRNKVKSLKNG